MSTLTICIVVLFCIGYMCIALESLTRVNKAAIEFAEKVAAFMEGFENPLTNAEIAAGLSNGAEKGEDGYVSFQKVAAAIRRLEGEGRVERIKGEKAKDKDTFVLA